MTKRNRSWTKGSAGFRKDPRQLLACSNQCIDGEHEKCLTPCPCPCHTEEIRRIRDERRRAAEELIYSNHPLANMYGCLPCPKCGSKFRWPRNSLSKGRLEIRCDDCDSGFPARREEDGAESMADGPKESP